ncbi:MAG: CRISPR-associated endonuclease Cas2 [Firmicutes bacterium]|nr:CRISPR-associated endonuclease Cas2 [Bacillota bacterium]
MSRRDILVTYDVNTETQEGRRRLRKIAQICENYGQRVQYSVFECSVTPVQLEQLEHEVVSAMDKDEDSIRLYVLSGGREAALRAYGRDRYVDFDAPLVI